MITYFVSYFYKDKQEDTGFGRRTFERASEIKKNDDIFELENDIRKIIGAKNVVLLYFKELSRDETKSHK